MPVSQTGRDDTMPQHWATNNLATAVFQTNRSGVPGVVTWSASAMSEDTRREKRRRRRQRVVNCCKKMVAFLFSHVGLAGMVVAYSILGGFLFQALEAPHELRIKVAVGRFKREKIEEISRLHETHAGEFGVNFTRHVSVIFTEFQRKVIDDVKLKGWDGKDLEEDEGKVKLQWSFAGALLYAVTVVTTIGYGHIAPKTNWGRIITILYALVGIPLTFLYLSNIGNFLADCFRLFYKRICCDVCCCQKCERQQKRQKLKLRRRREIIAAAASQRTIRLVVRNHVVSGIVADGGTTANAPRGSDISANTIPKSRAAKPEAVTLTCTNELRPETAGRRRSPKVSVGSSSVSGPSSSTATTAASPTNPVMTSSTNNGAYDNMRETEILSDEMSASRMRLPVTNNDVTTVTSSSCVDRKRPRLELATPPPTSLISEDLQRRMLIDFINSKETDFLDDDRRTAATSSRDINDGPRDQLVEEKQQAQSAESDVTARLTHSTSDRVADKIETETKRNTSKPIKTKAKSTGCIVAVANVSKPETGSDGLRQKPVERRRRYFRRRKQTDDENTSASCTPSTSALSPSDANSRPTSGVTSRDADKSSCRPTSTPVQPPISRIPKQCRAGLRVDGSGERQKMRSKSGGSNGVGGRRLVRSQSINKRPTAVSGDVKVKRSATFGAPDAAAKQPIDGSGSGALFRRFRHQLTPRLTGYRRPFVRKRSIDGSSVSLSGRDFAADGSDDVGGSVDSFVTACGDSAFRLDVERVPAGYDVIAPSRSCELAGCRTNSDNNMSAAEESERTWPPGVGRSSSSCTKDFRSLDAGSRRDMTSFPLVDDNEVDDDDDLFDFEQELALCGSTSTDGAVEPKVSVPISICLVIITVYIIAGSALFAIWEDWDYLTGSYFCFITLSTIGFGDYVPGTDSDQWANHEKLVLCTLWLAFGLSLLAMCFNLMQEEVKEKCKWLGRKLGLLKDEETR